MRTLQKTVIIATLAIAIGVSLYEARRSSLLQNQLTALTREDALAQEAEAQRLPQRSMRQTRVWRRYEKRTRNFARRPRKCLNCGLKSRVCGAVRPNR